MNRYLACIALLTPLLIGSFGAFNYYADPMLLFHHRGGNSETLDRVDQFRNMRLYKPLHIAQMQPNTIIIGSSRSGPLRPGNTNWDKNTRAYNFSAPGITLNEINRSVKHAHAHQPLKQLIVGLDYQAIVSPEPQHRPGYEQARMARDSKDLLAPAYLRQRAKDLQSSLFSFDILAESVNALATKGPRVRRFFADGTWQSTTRQLTGRGGYIFAARNTISTGEFQRFGSGRNMPLLRDLMDFCYRNNIQTRFFFTPTHVFVVDLWHQLASEKLWRRAHRDVIAISEELARQHGKPAYEIWGFGNEQGVVDEPIYYTRDIEKAWYDDGVHYRPKLGKEMIAVLARGDDTGFGQQLSADNIEAYLDSISALRSRFFQANGDLVTELQARIAQ